MCLLVNTGLPYITFVLRDLASVHASCQTYATIVIKVLASNYGHLAQVFKYR